MNKIGALVESAILDCPEVCRATCASLAASLMVERVLNESMRPGSVLSFWDCGDEYSDGSHLHCLHYKVITSPSLSDCSVHASRHAEQSSKSVPLKRAAKAEDEP